MASVRLLGGRYRLQEVVSTTRMAEVRLALDTDLERTVVVKLLARDADRARFEREARAVAALAHPNVVQLFDYGAADDRPFMVFEYLPGGSLEQRFAQASEIAHDEVTRLAQEVAAGLAHAHEHGVVHRDLKPANILFDAEARAKIADFGIASVQGADTLTDAGTVLGTAAYISPEQVRGDPVTPATDVYAFGVVLYRLLSGRLPFESGSAPELATMHRDLEPPPLDDVAERSPALVAVVMSALAKDPAARPADGALLLRALERAVGDGAPSPTAATTMEIRPPRRPRARRLRHTTLLVGSAALLAGGVVAAVLLTGRTSSAPAERVPTSQSPRSTTTGSTTAPPSNVVAPTTTAATTATRTSTARTSTATRTSSTESTPTTLPEVTPPTTTAPAETTTPAPTTTAP